MRPSRAAGSGCTRRTCGSRPRTSCGSKLALTVNARRTSGSSRSHRSRARSRPVCAPKIAGRSDRVGADEVGRDADAPRSDPPPITLPAAPSTSPTGPPAPSSPRRARRGTRHRAPAARGRRRRCCPSPSRLALVHAQDDLRLRVHALRVTALADLPTSRMADARRHPRFQTHHRRIRPPTTMRANSGACAW